MFKKILVANRGEVAVRVIRAAHELGIKCVAIYSEADRDSLHVQLADEAICIGPAVASQSYLDISRIVTAAYISGAEAIHPGWGFLSENWSFAEICNSYNIKFIGPQGEIIRQFADKLLARKLMHELNVPILPPIPTPIENIQHAKKIANEIGYPLIIKAAAGGGGKGMRIVTSETELAGNLQIAQTESKAAFNSDLVYIEKYIHKPRHIEVQILGDEYGNVVHLFERECSIQYRYQKLIEEAPSVALDWESRERLCSLAAKAAKKVGYSSSGTIEFLMDEEKNFYFIEMNTRLQVEHPVTEAICGIDIVKWQILIAAGYPLEFTQADITPRGHAIECRINAQNTAADFLPSTGTITRLHLPGGCGIRVDTFIYQGYKVPEYYDGLLGKIIAYGENRDEAIRRMQRALSESLIEGIDTTIPFHKTVMADEYFQKGEIHTHFLHYITSKNKI